MIRRTPRIVIALPAAVLASALSARSGSAYPPDYGPFDPNHEPARFPLAECPMVAEEGPAVVMGRQTMVYGDDRTGGPRLRASAASFFEGVTIEVVEADGKAVAGPSYASDFPPHSRPDSAFCADLNHDGRLDFVLPLASRGNGLGMLFHELVVALSSGSKYRIWIVPTAAPGPEDFLVLTDPGQCVIVKASFASNESPAESRRHSYWVYNLLAVRNDELVEANDLGSRFPKWIWYTARPNHKPAALSAAEKNRIWSLQREPMVREASPDAPPKYD